MKLFREWIFFILAWVLSWTSFLIWPKVNMLNFGLKEDLFAALLFKPFHYLSSFLLLIMVILLLFEVISKAIYEYKIAWLLKIIPYETLALSLFTIYLYAKIIRFYPYLASGLSIIFATYYLIDYFHYRKKEMIYVKEG